jgi:hypothetical protein
MHGLGTGLGIGTIAPEKDEALDARKFGGVEDRGLQGEVFPDELRRVELIGPNAADPGGGEKYETRSSLLEITLYLPRLSEVQLISRAGEEVRESLSSEGADERGPQETSVSGDEDGVFQIQESGSSE